MGSVLVPVEQKIQQCQCIWILNLAILIDATNKKQPEEVKENKIYSFQQLQNFLLFFHQSAMLSQISDPSVDLYGIVIKQLWDFKIKL